MRAVSRLEVSEGFRELGEGLGQIVGREDGAVVLVDTLHKVHAIAHFGGENDHDGLILASESLGLGHAIEHLLHVVTIVDDHHGPHKGLKFGTEVAEVHDLHGGTVDLLVVVVDGGDEVVDMLGTGEHDGFPDLSFLQLAVAVEGVYKVAVACHLFAKGSTDADAHALAKRAASHADAGEAVFGGGVPLQACAELAEGFKLFDGEETAAGHGAVDNGSNVSLRDEEHILVLAIHGEVVGVVLEYVELHGSHPVGGAERATRVSGLGGSSHTEDIAAHLRSDSLKFLGGFH